MNGDDLADIQPKLLYRAVKLHEIGDGSRWIVRIWLRIEGVGFDERALPRKVDCQHAGIVKVTRVVEDNYLLLSVSECAAADEPLKDRYALGSRQAIGVNRVRVGPGLPVIRYVAFPCNDRGPLGSIGAQSAGVVEVSVGIDDIANGFAGDK